MSTNATEAATIRKSKRLLLSPEEYKNPKTTTTAADVHARRSNELLHSNNSIFWKVIQDSRKNVIEMTLISCQKILFEVHDFKLSIVAVVLVILWLSTVLTIIALLIMKK